MYDYDWSLVMYHVADVIDGGAQASRNSHKKSGVDPWPQKHASRMFRGYHATFRDDTIELLQQREREG